MSCRPATENRFLTAPIAGLFLYTALPMAVVMSLGGLLNIVDAVFLGRFVGPDALAAVSLAFPVVMVTIALSTLVSGGMSSLLARYLGAKEFAAARSVFACAHGLTVVVALALIAVFLMISPWLFPAGNDGITGIAYDYLFIMICAAPVQFILGVHADALRNEGQAGVMALLSVGVTLANIVLNWLLIVWLDMGIAGSAWGTVMAQALGLLLALILRLSPDRVIPLSVLWRYRWSGQWGRLLSLGAPLSLSFLGMALVSATVLAVLTLGSPSDYPGTIAAYGVVTRIMGFSFLPLMAMALTIQSIVGNNAGAGQNQRVASALQLGLGIAALYCLIVELTLLLGGDALGRYFVSDGVLISQVAAILHPMVALYLFAGPVLVLALYFQALGQSARAGVLTLVKPFLLSPVLLVALAWFIGGQAIWFAFPIADGIVVSIALWLCPLRSGGPMTSVAGGQP